MKAIPTQTLVSNHWLCLVQKETKVKYTKTQMKQWLLTIHLHVKRDCWNQRQMLQKGIRSVSQNTLINKCKQCSGTLKNKQTHTKQNKIQRLTKQKQSIALRVKQTKKQTKSKGDQGKKNIR